MSKGFWIFVGVCVWFVWTFWVVASVRVNHHQCEWVFIKWTGQVNVQCNEEDLKNLEPKPSNHNKGV